MTSSLGLSTAPSEKGGHNRADRMRWRFHCGINFGSIGRAKWKLWSSALICGSVAGSYIQCWSTDVYDEGPMRYHSGRCIVVNFKQIQEVFAEGLAIYLKYFEAFLEQICSSGTHSYQSRRPSYWCWYNLQCLGCGPAWQTDPSE